MKIDENFANYSLQTTSKTIGAVKSKPKTLRHIKVDPVLNIDETVYKLLNLCVFIKQTKSYNHSLRTDEDIKLYRNFESQVFLFARLKMAFLGIMQEEYILNKDAESGFLLT